MQSHGCREDELYVQLYYFVVHVASVWKCTGALLVLPLCYVDLDVFGTAIKNILDVVACLCVCHVLMMYKHNMYETYSLCFKL